MIKILHRSTGIYSGSSGSTLTTTCEKIDLLTLCSQGKLGVTKYMNVLEIINYLGVKSSISPSKYMKGDFINLNFD